MKWTLQTILAALIGAGVAASISVGVWALAYFGDISLHLPSKLTYTYTSVDRYIGENLPPHYQFTVNDVRNFRGTGSDTLLVVANPGLDLLTAPLHGKVVNGIVILLDRTEGGSYQIDYKFEPKFNLKLSDGRIVNSDIAVTPTSLPSFGTTVLVAQWLPNSNGIPPIFGLFLFDDGGATKSFPVYSGDRSSPLPGSERYTYSAIVTQNVFPPYQRELFDEYQVLGLSSDGSILALDRTDMNCDFCDHQYRAESYFLDPTFGLQGGHLAPQNFSDPTVRSQIRLWDPFGIG